MRQRLTAEQWRQIGHRFQSHAEHHAVRGGDPPWDGLCAAAATVSDNGSPPPFYALAPHADVAVIRRFRPRAQDCLSGHAPPGAHGWFWTIRTCETVREESEGRMWAAYLIAAMIEAGDA